MDAKTELMDRETDVEALDSVDELSLPELDLVGGGAVNVVY